MRAPHIGLVSAGVLVLAASCGDDTDTFPPLPTSTSTSTTTTTSSGTGGTGGENVGGSGGTGGDTGGAGGAGGSGGSGGSGGGEPAEPVVMPISPMGTDGFFGVAFEPGGSFYAVGVTAETTEATSDRSVVVAKFLPNGDPDPSFGAAGIATKNIIVGGGNGEMARGIGVQSTGKIVISATVEHDITAVGTAAADRDVAVVRFNTDGTIDDTFGDEGVVILNFNDGIEVMNMGSPAWAAPDNQWSLGVDPDDKIIVHGNQRATGFQPDGTTPRSDTDWVLVRLGPNGNLDNSFGTNGKFTLDIEQVSGNARNATVLADGSIIGSGYANTPGLGTTQPVIYKVTPAGQLDPSFGGGGVFHQIVLPTLTEAYTAVLQDTNLVTAGYGQATMADSIDWVSLRLTGDGDLDPTYGENGSVLFDVAGEADRARNLIALPDDRLMLVGTGTPTAGMSDAMIGVLTPQGQPDDTFAPNGFRVYDLGGVADVFWAAALSPDQSTVVFVGLRGAGNMNVGAMNNDDAAIFVMPLD